MLGKLLTFLAAPVTLALVFGTGMVEYHTLKELLPNTFVAFIIIITIAFSKILVTFLYRKYRNNEKFSESSRGLAIFSAFLMFLFATIMATVTINSGLYKTNVNDAYVAIQKIKKESSQEKLDQKLSYINERIDFYNNEVEKQRYIKGKYGVYKGDYYNEYSEKLQEYENQKLQIINIHWNDFELKAESIDQRLTELDDKNPVFASFVYAMQDVSKGDSYGISIFLVALIFSLMAETLTITMANYLGIIYKLY